MLSPKNRNSWGFSFKKGVCYFLILNHIWLGCAQATHSITGLSDAETQAEEYAFRHLSQMRVQIDSVPSDDPDSTLSGLRLRAFKTQYHPDYAKKQEEDLEGKTQILQQETEFDLLQTILNPSVLDMDQLLPNMTPSGRGVSWQVAGLDLFVTWEGKIEVRGGKTGSLSLETDHSIKILNPVFAKSLTLIADHSSVRAPLMIEQDLDIVSNNFLKGLTIRSSDEGRDSILQAKNITVHEGSLEIQEGATLSLEPGGILNLNHNDLLNYDLLEALEEGSIENIRTLHNRGSITGHRLSLQGQTLKNEEEGTLQGHHLTMVLNNLNNGGQILSPKHIDLAISDRLDNQGDIVSKGSLALKGEGSLLNRGTLQSGTKGKLSLEINKVVNTRLIKSEGEMLLNPGKKFLNEQGGWVQALRSTEIRGNGTLINRSHQIKGEHWLNPDLEGAGFSPEADLWFHDFQGTIINEGSWATKGKVSGFLHHLENNGHWRAGMTGLEVGLFLNHFSDGVTGGLVDAPGFWKIRKGDNHGILQGEYLHVQVGKEFNQSERGAVKTENLLKFTGEGTLNLKGKVLSNREILLDAKEIEMSTHVQAPKITLGEKVVRWVRQQAGDWIFKTLSLLGEQTLGINKGLLQGDLLTGQGTLENEEVMRFQKTDMTAGSIFNKLGGEMDLGESNLILDTLMNNSTLNLKGVTARVRKTSNTDFMGFEEDSAFIGNELSNTGTIAVDVFSLTMGEDLKQLKKMSAKRKLSLEARQIISDLNSETSSEQNLSVKTEKPLVSQGTWKGKESFHLKTPDWVNKGTIESPRETDIIVGGGDLTNDHEMTLNGLSLSLKPGKSLLNQHKLTITGIEALSPHMNIKNTGTLQIQMEVQDKPALLSLEERENPVASKASKDLLNYGKFSGINAKGARGTLDLETGLVYPAAKTQISPDIFLPKEHKSSKDPMDLCLQEELRKYAAEMNSAIKGDSSIWKESVFLLDPLCYIVRNELRSFLWDVEHSRNYAPDMRKDYAPYTRFTVEQKIQNLAARHLKKIGELKLGPLTNASFTTLMGDVETLNSGGYYQPWGFGQRFVSYEKLGTIPLGQRFAQWDKARGITEKIVPRLINEGLNFLKNTRQWFGKEGYPYALTQNLKGNIAVSSPYVPLVYPLFSDERIQGDAYLPKTFRNDNRNAYLYQEIARYIDENLDKSKNKEGTFLGFSAKHAVYHLDPLFYVTRQAVMFSDGRSKRDVAKQLQNAFSYHIFMTPLYTKDTKGEISKVLTLRLLDKGFAMFRDGSLKWLRLSSLQNENQLILSGGTWHPENLVNAKGSMIQLGRGTSLYYPNVQNDGIIKGLENLEIEGDDNVLKLWSLQAGKDLTFKLSDKVDAAKILKDYRKYWKLNGTLTLDTPWFHHTDHTILPYPLRVITQDFLNAGGVLQSHGMDILGGGRARNGLLSQQLWGELLSTDFMNIDMYSVDNGWGRMRSEAPMFLHTLSGNIENGALVKTTKTSFPAPYHLPYRHHGSQYEHWSHLSDLIRGGDWIQNHGETPVKVHHGNQAVIFCNSDLTMIADHGNIHNDYGNIYSGGDMIASLPEGKFRTLAGNLWVNGNAHITGQRWSLERTPGESYLYEAYWKGSRGAPNKAWERRIHLDTSDPSSAKILGHLLLQVNESFIDGSSLLVGGQIYSDGKNPLNLQNMPSSFKVKGSHGGKPSVVMSKQNVLINTGDFGLEGYREVGAQPVTQTIIIDLAEMAKAMMKQNPLIQIQKKKGLPRLTLGGELAEGNNPYQMMFDSQSPLGIPYLDAQVFQHVLMDVLASYAGTLSLKSVQELDWEGQTRALFRQGQKIAQKKQGALTQEDLKGLETSALVFKKQTIDGIDYEVAQFLLNPKDLNPLGNNNTTMTAPSVKIMTHQSDIKNATIVGTENKVSLKVSEKSHMMGTLYGEKKVKHQADILIQGKPVDRYLEEVTETKVSSGIMSKKVTRTKRQIEHAIALIGGRTLTGEEGGVYLDARQLLSIGATVNAGKKGIYVHTSELFDDHPLIEVLWHHYHAEKQGSYGGGYSEDGYVRQEVIHRSSWISKGSIVMEHDGKASYGAPLIKTTEGDVSIVAKKELSVPGVKAKQEDTPTLSVSGTKIEKTIGSREIGEIMRIEALRKIRLESGEQISGVRPHMISQTQEIKAPKISIMEEIDFRKTLKRDQQTFVVGSTVDPGLMLVMSAAITAVTAGAGSVSLGAAFASAMGIAETSAVTFAMVSAGANAIANQAILSGIVNKGNLGEVVKEITSEDSLKSLGITMATAGLGEQFGIKAPGGKSGFEKHLQYQAKKALMDNTFKVALKGEKIEEALKNAGMQVIVNSFASYGAQKIGATFDPEKGVEDYLSHKTMHGVLGGLTGFALEGDIKGAVSGVMGAVVSEIVAEQMVDRQAIETEVEKKALKKGWSLDDPRVEEEIRKRLQSTIDKTKVVAGTLALLSGQKVDVALQTATNALENNFFNHATGKILEEQRKAYAEKLYYALDALQDKLVGGMSLEKAQRDLEHWKDHMIEGAFGYGDLWQENGQEIARFIGGNERLESVLGMGGKGAGTAFGLAMTMYRGKPGGKTSKPNSRTFQGLDLQKIEKRTIHNNPLARQNIEKVEQKIQAVHPLKRGADNPSDTIRGLDLAESKALQNNPFLKQNIGNAENKGLKSNYLEYENASYHHQQSIGMKSKNPKNGAELLQESIKIKETSERRIAVDKSSGNFVIFDQHVITKPYKYHGHVRTWNELDQEMQSLLRKTGLVSKNGKIL